MPIHSLRSVQAAEASIRKFYLNVFKTGIAYRALVPWGDNPKQVDYFITEKQYLLNTDMNASRTSGTSSGQAATLCSMILQEDNPPKADAMEAENLPAVGRELLKPETSFDSLRIILPLH
jgi:hypothetical protein